MIIQTTSQKKWTASRKYQQDLKWIKLWGGMTWLEQLEKQIRLGLLYGDVYCN